MSDTKKPQGGIPSPPDRLLKKDKKSPEEIQNSPGKVQKPEPQQLQSIIQPVALITGASSGIGTSLARRYANRSFRLILCARRMDRLKEVAQQCQFMNPATEVEVIKCDVTKPEHLEKTAQIAEKKFGRLDVVVAIAGFAIKGAVEKLKLDDYRRQFDTNVFGVLNTYYASIAQLKKTRGRFCIIGSANSYVTLPQVSAYCMSKHAVQSLAEALYHEHKKDGVSVTLALPGFVETEIMAIDNKGKFHPNAKRPIPWWLIMSSARAADQIYDAIRKRRREAVISVHALFILWFKRFTPWLMEALIGRFGRRLLTRHGKDKAKAI